MSCEGAAVGKPAQDQLLSRLESSDADCRGMRCKLPCCGLGMLAIASASAPLDLHLLRPNRYQDLNTEP